MTTDPIPRDNTEYETQPTITYEEYRTLCDELQPEIYRKTGVCSAEDYEVARDDARTVHIEIDGRRIPLFVPLEHAGGYNVEGTQRMTDRENVYALALPLEFIEERGLDLNTYLEALDDNSAVVVQTGSGKTSEIKAQFVEAIGAEDAWEVQEFIDHRVERGPQTANVSIYQVHFKAVSQDGEPVPRNDRSMREHYEEEVAEFGETSTKLVEADQIQDNDELFQQLWDLQEEKFYWLGEYHPVSMEENKEYFKLLLTDARTKSFVRYARNEQDEEVPVSHGIMLEGISMAEWIAEHFMQEIADTAEANGNERVMFYYGIVGKESKEEGVKYAEDVMRLPARLLNRGGGNILIVFESTNMSSQYIPGLVQIYVGAEPRGIKQQSKVERVSTLDYWALVSKSKETV